MVLNLYYFFSFESPLLREVQWQHHNFSINCRSSKFPHAGKSCSTARNCLPLGTRQREWKLGWQEETFHLFSNFQGVRGPCIIHGEVLRVFGQTQWRANLQDFLVRYLLQLTTLERCRNVSIPLGRPGQGTNAHCSYTNLAEQGHYEIDQSEANDSHAHYRII